MNNLSLRPGPWIKHINRTLSTVITLLFGYKLYS